MTKIKCIIPIAGFGTRFLPATKAVPKTLFPIIDVPAIHYLVQEAIEAGCTEIIVVLSRSQDMIKDYFADNQLLRDVLLAKDKLDLLADILAITKEIKYQYVYQDEQLGDGHALLCAKDFLGDEPVLVLFGDDIVDPAPAKVMVDLFQKTGNPVVALVEVPLEMVDQYGIAAVKDFQGSKCQIERIIEKPTLDQAPSCYGVVGKYLITPEIFNILNQGLKSADGEIRLVEALNQYLEVGQINGYVLPGKRYDIGSKWGFIEATIDYALKRPDLKVRLMNYLKKIS